MMDNQTDRERLYKEIFEKYDKLSKEHPYESEIYFNWGNDLISYANRKDGKELERIYNLAFEKYQKVIDLGDDEYETIYNWGSALGDLARSKNGVGAENIYKKAFEKYQEAIEIESGDYEIYFNWGTDLLDLARKFDDEKRDYYLDEAIKILTQSINLGEGYFNLSCVYLLKGDMANSLKYLEESLVDKEIDIDKVLEDDDWKGYLDDGNVLEIVNKFK